MWHYLINVDEIIKSLPAYDVTDATVQSMAVSSLSVCINLSTSYRLWTALLDAPRSSALDVIRDKRSKVANPHLDRLVAHLTSLKSHYESIK
jgi:hypothetical protein